MLSSDNDIEEISAARAMVLMTGTVSTATNAAAVSSDLPHAAHEHQIPSRILCPSQIQPQTQMASMRHPTAQSGEQRHHLAPAANPAPVPQVKLIEPPSWTKEIFASHKFFMSALLEWGAPFGLFRFSTGNSVKNTQESGVDLDLFPYRRCVLRCQHCHGKDKTFCGFQVSYNYQKKAKEISKITLVLPYDSKHNNNMFVSLESDSHYVNHATDLTSEEKTFLLAIGPDRLAMPKVRLSLNRQFGQNRVYNREVLKWMMKKGRNQFLGNDKDSMRNLFKLGRTTESGGGLFQHSFCNSSLKLESFHLQESIEKELVAVYGRLFHMDSSHHTTKYMLRVCPPKGIDCLGLSCPFGYSMIGAESTEFVTDVLENLDLANKGATAATDRAPGWEDPLKKFGINQVFDGWHYGNDATTASAGLGVLGTRFRKDISSAMYQDMGTVEALDAHLQSLLDALPTDHSSHKFVIEFIKNKKKVCITHTGELFHCSNGALSRGEATMSTIKGNGTLKEPMRHWTLYEFALHMQSLTRAYVAKATSMIKKLLMEGKEISDWVQKRLEAANALVGKYRSVKLHENWLHTDRNIVGAVYGISNKTQPGSHVHEVFIPNDPKLHPSCSCRKYKVCCIAHEHVARAYIDLEDRQFFSNDTLDPYWKLERHPCYKFAKADVLYDASQSGVTNGSSSAQTVTDSAAAPDGSEMNTESSKSCITLDTYKKIPFPKNPNSRYNSLHGLFLKLADYAKTNKGTYQRTMVQLKAMLDQAEAELNNQEVNDSLPLPPSERGGRQNEGVANNSIPSQIARCQEAMASSSVKKRKTAGTSNVRKKGRGTGSCSTCTARGIAKPHGHRAGGRCPFKNQFCEYCMKVRGEATNLHDASNCPHAGNATGEHKDLKAALALPVDDSTLNDQVAPFGIVNNAAI